MRRSPSIRRASWSGVGNAATAPSASPDPWRRCSTRSTRRAIRCAVQGSHAVALVARPSASVSAASSRSRSIVPTWLATCCVVAGSSMSRRVATSRRSRCCSTSQTTVAMSSGANPIRSQMRSAMRAPAAAWSSPDPLPMSCSSAAISRRSGRSTCGASRDAAATVSSRCRSTVKSWNAPGCGRERTVRHSGNTHAHTPRWSSPSITRTAQGPEPKSSISWRRVSSSHGSSHGEAAAASRSSERRSMTAP